MRPDINCQTWTLSAVETTYMSISLFSGMFAASNYIGAFSDTHGRRAGCLLAMTCSTVFGTLSALSPSYWFLCLARFGVGFGYGCNPAPVVLISEIAPTATR